MDFLKLPHNQQTGLKPLREIEFTKECINVCRWQWEKFKVMEGEACSWTIEGLRGRLLAERVISRTAKEQVEHLEKRLIELRGQLTREIESRDRAQMKLKWLTQKIKSLNGNGSTSSSTAFSDLNLQEKHSPGSHFDDNVEDLTDMTSSLIMRTAHEEDPSSKAKDM